MFFSSEHREVLTDAQTWTDNPFIDREARRDRKRWQPLIAFSWMCGILLFTMAAGFYLLAAVSSYLHHMPWFLGGDLGTALCILVSGIQIFFITGAAQKHTTRLLNAEANQNTLSSLLTLPSSNFQLVLQLTVYPWFVGMRMAVYLLPVYVFCIGIDGLSWLDLAMLYVVFAVNAFAVPIWNRPALSENLAIVPIGKPQAGFNAVQTSPQAKNVARSPNAALSMAFVIPVVTTLYALATRRGLGAAYGDMHQYLPDSVISLTSSSILSWPLMMARLLVAPLDWFGFPVLPILLLAPIFLLAKYCQIVRTSEYLSVGSYRELARQPTYFRRKRMEAALNFAKIVVVAGYLWQWGVRDGALSFVSVKIVGATPGLAGFGCCLLLIYGIASGIRAGNLGAWLHSPVMKAENPIVRKASFASCVRYVLEPFLAAIAIYFLCCLFSRTGPFPHLLRGNSNLSTPMFALLMVGVSGALLNFGTSRLFGMGSVALRLCVLAGIILSGALQSSQDIQAWAASLPQIKSMLSALPGLQKLELFSPLAGMLHLMAPNWTNFNQFLPNSPPWTQWVSAASVAGAFMTALGCLAAPRTAQIKQAGENAVVLDPTIVGMDAFADPVAFKNDATNKQDSPLANYVIHALQKRVDNGILVKEMRAKLRGKWEKSTIITCWAMIAVGTACLFHPYVSPFIQPLGGVLSNSFGNSSALGATMAGSLILWLIIAGAVTFAFSFSTMNLFFAETQKSTLSFLLTTPMKTGEIFFGKVAGALAPSIGLLSLIYLWTFLMSLIFSLVLGWGILVAWGVTVSVFIAFYLTMNLSISAVASLFPRLSLAQAGWIWVVILYFAVFPLIGIVGLTSSLMISSGLGPFGILLCILGVLALISFLSIVIAIGGITSMRKKDFSEGSNKRS